MGIAERKQREKELRRAQIIEAARKVFSTKGFNTATMEEIAAQAELSPGTLYLYFKNKEELHTSLSIEILEHLTREVKKVVAKDISVEEKLDQLKHVFIDVYEYDSMILINLFHLQSGETLRNLSPEVLKQLKRTSSEAHGAIIEVIKEGIDKEIFIDEHPVALADVVWATFSGVVLWVDSKRFLNNKKDFVTSTLKTAFTVIANGLRRQ
ncbi:MAG: TetR/AcrR family transcriptional regulator [Desulfobacteraceae bacterium]|nr:MAG: TetR/AcrR family transcriptional regulator [Desulfobacteraceae bacterium]